MYSVEIFDKLIQLGFTVLPYTEDIVYVSVPYQRLEMVVVYIFDLETAHEDVGIQGCHSGSHGGSTYL